MLFGVTVGSVSTPVVNLYLAIGNLFNIFQNLLVAVVVSILDASSLSTVELIVPYESALLVGKILIIPFIVFTEHSFIITDVKLVSLSNTLLIVVTVVVFQPDKFNSVKLVQLENA